MRWDGATAVITGASQGIGRTVATAAVGGKRVGLIARSGEELAALRDRLGGPAVASIAVADLTDNSQLEQAIVALDGELGGIDVLVNNAGIGGWGPFVDTPDGELDQVLALNLVAAMRMARRVLPGMIRRRRGHRQRRLGGRPPRRPVRGDLLGRSKFGLTGFTEALAVELGGSASACRWSIPGRSPPRSRAAVAHRAVRWPPRSTGACRGSGDLDRRGRSARAGRAAVAAPRPRPAHDRAGHVHPRGAAGGRRSARRVRAPLDLRPGRLKPGDADDPGPDVGTIAALREHRRRCRGAR